MRIEITGSPIEYAKRVSASELKKTIKACSRGEYDEFNDRCRICFEKYLMGDLDSAQWWSNHAELVR